MKFTYSIVGMLLFAITSCEKAAIVNTPHENSGCIERIIIPVDAYTIPGTEIPVVKNLFLNNGIGYQHFRFYQYQDDSVQTFYPPYVKVDFKVVRAIEYTNDLPILNGYLLYNFQDNILHYKAGPFTNGTSLNTIPALTLTQLRKLFIEDLELYDHKGAQFKDTCLKAEFGYFNLNAGTANTQEVLVKAWKVTPKNTVFPSEYPVAFYQDDNAGLIYYFNGIQTFR